MNQTAGAGAGILSQGGDAPLSKALEKNEDVLRQDPHSSLGTLAQSTGGLIFDSTNNLRQGFDRVETDLRNYYLVGYTPSNEAYDGRFRTIDVKVKRPGLTVAARQGLLRRPRYGRRRSPRTKRRRSASSSGSRCRTRSPCARARSSFPNAIAPASSR